MSIFNKNKKSKNDTEQESNISIRKTKLDENGMEYEVEEQHKSFKDEDVLKITLQNLIKDNAGGDPFWEDCLIKYFDNVNKTEIEKVKFLYNLSLNKGLFNEFTKEIVKPLNVDEIFEKYNRLLNNKDDINVKKNID